MTLRTLRLQGLRFLVISLLALAAVACGGWKSRSTGQPSATPTPEGVEATIISSDLAVGPNRFMVGLWDPAKNALIIDAQLHFRIFKLDGQGGGTGLKAEVDARPLTIEKNFTHVHEGGKLETHGAGVVGIYVAQVGFDSSGQWGVEITGTADGRPIGPLRPAFAVAEKSSSIAVGDPAPRTVQTILADVGDISEIDTSNPPSPHMHSMTIADAVTSGKPTIIVFATPGFCITKLCGPSKEAVDALYEKYNGQANFIHVEPYDLEKARSGQELKTLPWIVPEWGLRTEPWIFLVDREGKIASKFEGVVSTEELEAALSALLASGTRY